MICCFLMGATAGIDWHFISKERFSPFYLEYAPLDEQLGSKHALKVSLELAVLELDCMLLTGQFFLLK